MLALTLGFFKLARTQFKASPLLNSLLLQRNSTSEGCDLPELGRTDFASNCKHNVNVACSAGATALQVLRYGSAAVLHRWTAPPVARNNKIKR